MEILHVAESMFPLNQGLANPLFRDMHGRARTTSDQPQSLSFLIVVKIISSAMLLRAFALSLLLSSALSQKWVPAVFYIGVRQALEDSLGSYKINKQYGGSLSAFAAGNNSFHFEMGVIYRFVDLSHLRSYPKVLPRQHYLAGCIGIRYYPYAPTLKIGSLAFRLTAASSIGGGIKFIKDEWYPDLSFLLKAALKISLEGKPTGILLEWLFLPLEEPILNSDNLDQSIVIKPTHLVGLGFIFAD